jgi:hypothetical protein
MCVKRHTKSEEVVADPPPLIKSLINAKSNISLRTYLCGSTVTYIVLSSVMAVTGFRGEDARTLSSYSPATRFPDDAPLAGKNKRPFKTLRSYRLGWVLRL